MMLQMEMAADGFGVRKHSDAMHCLNKHRCTGKYDNRRGMKRLLRSTSWENEREFKPWRNRWHFFSYKNDGRWSRGEAGRNFAKRSSLYRSGRESVCLDTRKCGRASLINHPACFHSDKHRVDCSIYSHDCGNEHYEVGISFDLDGVHNIDHIENWVVCHEASGRWSCSDCMETGHPNAEAGYVKATFDSKQALLLDHMACIMKGIHYLCSQRHVDVFLDNPGDIGNSSSAVMLRCDVSQKKQRSLVSIGKVAMSPLKSGASDTVRWIYHRLAAELQNEKNKHQGTD